MNKKRDIIFSSFLLAAAAVSAQNLNTEITVSHEVVPEERAATRLRLLPSVSLPSVNPGRLPSASRFTPATMTPFINRLEAACYADSLRRSPWRGYASLIYGPTYNLSASAGYRFIESRNLILDGYMQFNGMSYVSKYPAIDYDGKVCFRRNTAMAGAKTSWTTTKGVLDASLLYQYSGYDFPILDYNVTNIIFPHRVDANVAKANVGWAGRAENVSYRVGADYGLIYFGGRNNANNNRIALTAAVDWMASSKSLWGVDFGYSLVHSTIAGNKGILHVLPRYAFSVNSFKVRLGADIDIKTGNTPFKPALLIAPDVNIVWQPSHYFSIWGQVNGRMVDNYRGDMFDEQPYLLPDFEAGLSRIYNADAGITLGAFRGASISVFGGYTIARDWYMPAIATGYMTAMDVKGAHAGATFKYDYRRILSVNVRADIAQAPRGDYSCGFAPWRDHARFNLVARVSVRPIEPLDISLGYNLRTGRQKQMKVGDLALQNVNNLQACVTYKINRQWSAFVRGENLMNKHWYLGPAVPSQGITGMVGASYKF